MDETTREFLAVARKYLRDDYLPKIEHCLERLTDEQVWWRPHESSNSIGNLLLHLEGNARQWILSGVGGRPDARVRQREFDERAPLPPAGLLGRLRTTLAEVDGVLARLDAPGLRGRLKIQGHDVSVLEAVFHVVEHFSMHTGQIILLTKTLTASDLAFYDLSAGDPRPDWRRAGDGED